MELSEKEKKELDVKYDKIHEKVLYLVVKHRGIDGPLMALLLYLSSENLIKWTKIIAGTSVALIIFAIIQIIVLISTI